VPRRRPQAPRGLHFSGRVREWLWSYLEPEGDQDASGRPNLDVMTELLWDCGDPMGRGKRGAVASWCDRPRCPPMTWPTPEGFSVGSVYLVAGSDELGRWCRAEGVDLQRTSIPVALREVDAAQ
jgi:hypothetical protein